MGGIPRFVLEKANDQAQQDKLQNAIVRENENDDDISHKLIHISTNLPEENDID
ncbi:27973_t:CDS:2 [Racocetra persica]|uniref:27973_t:CDS:1 n=1 Tax=Racocetra persica TaxID=160502 RepID=A0ACA9QBS0_9GLOM|nr:27973_t:CDS:2 [Racocetra persica]